MRRDPKWGPGTISNPRIVGKDVYKRQLPPRFVELSAICVAVIVLTTIWSGVEYFMKNLDVLSEVK